MHWQHIVLGTRCSWLHGDRRGYRDRGHRTHSSGDYKNPPPEGENAGLRRYYQRRSGKPVEFDLEVRIEICRQFVSKMRSLGFRIIACAVCGEHLHALVELVSDYHDRRKVIGKCKQKASHAVREVLPGTIWAEGGEFKPIKDQSHFQNTYNYIRTKQEAGAVVWSHHPTEDWIANESIGIILMSRTKKQTRVFGVPQTSASQTTTPVSEGTPEDPGIPVPDLRLD
jgi:REP element-mobilizing transposase RayT